jgi:hypothetical protein
MIRQAWLVQTHNLYIDEPCITDWCFIHFYALCRHIHWDNSFVEWSVEALLPAGLLHLLCKNIDRPWSNHTISGINKCWWMTISIQRINETFFSVMLTVHKIFICGDFLISLFGSRITFFSPDKKWNEYCFRPLLCTCEGKLNQPVVDHERCIHPGKRFQKWLTICTIIVHPVTTAVLIIKNRLTYVM